MSSRSRVLVVGVYLADQDHRMSAIVPEFAASRHWQVEQRWAGLGSRPSPQLDAVTTLHVEAPAPKFVLINRLLAQVPLDDLAYVVLCDDDVDLAPGFIDRYLALVERHDFALAQPARTADSYIDHPFVAQLTGIDARWTHFVEIGPVVSIRRDALGVITPFDEASPMGWGYDFVWPRLLGVRGLKLGIVDAVPVGHRIRQPVTRYDYGSAAGTMQRWLAERPHMSKADAFRIVASYVDRRD